MWTFTGTVAVTMTKQVEMYYRVTLELTASVSAITLSSTLPSSSVIKPSEKRAPFFIKCASSDLRMAL